MKATKRTKVKPKRVRARRVDSTPAAVIAAALAESDRQPDADVAKRYGVAAGTIHTWRTRLGTDDELAKLVALERRRLATEWRDEAGLTLIALSREIRKRIGENKSLDFALIGAVKIYGAVCVEASALLGDDPDAEPAATPPPPPPPSHDDAPNASTEVHH